MKKQGRRLISVLLTLCFGVGLWLTDMPSTAPQTVKAAGRRVTDVTVPAPGNVLVAVNGSFSTAGKQTVLAKLNRIRKEAYDEGLVKRYVPVQWSYEMEWMAQTRAAESAVLRSHTRLNGRSNYSLSVNGVYLGMENLAWEMTSGEAAMLEAIERWYAEKADYVVQQQGGQPNGITGHYEQMIDPQYAYTGLGSFSVSDSDAWTAIAQVSGDQAGSSQAQTGEYGQVTQLLEVRADMLSALSIVAPTTLKVGANYRLTASALLTGVSELGLGAVSVPVTVQAAQWSVSPTALASIDADGNLTAHGRGQVMVSLQAGGMTQAVQVALRDEGRWIKSGSRWAYLMGDGSWAVSRWIGHYYIGADGWMLTSAFTPDGYRVDATGRWVKAGWIQDGNGWWYRFTDGFYYHNGWVKIGGKWYHFQDDGYLNVSKWLGHYYVDHNGVMLTSAFTPDGYRVDAYGRWAKGSWKRDDNGWWYEFADGAYYRDGWQEFYGTWYHFRADGYLTTSTWVGSCYVDDSGRMLTDTITPDGWYVNANGYASGRAW